MIFSWVHIAVNICAQIFIGIPLEMVYERRRILIIYLAGVLSGSLFTSFVDPTKYVAGASGGVYSLLAAHVAILILVRNIHYILNSFTTIESFPTYSILNRLIVRAGRKWIDQSDNY